MDVVVACLSVAVMRRRNLHAVGAIATRFRASSLALPELIEPLERPPQGSSNRYRSPSSDHAFGVAQPALSTSAATIAIATGRN